ncbi:MAG TPA: hypothetical protein VFV19_17935 [Candidatus Polarisedimenticolaceae bacterium]|nr:hypothetical protein [Candidatus Polarisedimenticolaceae bacterium]
MRKLAYLLLLVPGVALADQVFLKDAGSIEGRIVEQTADTVKVDVGDGVIGVPASRVEKIVKGKSHLDEYDERAAKLKAGDVNGWRSLGQWASQQGLASQSRAAYQKVLAVAPDDPAARKALGFVSLDGKWVTEEESYRARGYVKYENEWMTAAQAQVAQQNDANERARRDAEHRAIAAENAAREAQARADEAEKKAKEEEELRRRQDPVYWGGWGYGMTYWPTAPMGNGTATLNLAPKYGGGTIKK